VSLLSSLPLLPFRWQCVLRHRPSRAVLLSPPSCMFELPQYFSCRRVRHSSSSLSSIRRHLIRRCRLRLRPSPSSSFASVVLPGLHACNRLLSLDYLSAATCFYCTPCVVVSLSSSSASCRRRCRWCRVVVVVVVVIAVHGVSSINHSSDFSSVCLCRRP
jgi:hypothetical protein